MKKTAMQLLIDQCNKELQKPLEVLADHRAYHINALRKATVEVHEIRKRIDQATELLENEREQIEEAYNCGNLDNDGFTPDKLGEQYFKETYG